MVCSSGIGFDPIINGKRYTFGAEGVWLATAVLYDKQTESLWYHFKGECFDGPLEGTVMRRISSGRHTTWDEWRSAHPQTDVIKPEAVYVDRPQDKGYFAREVSRSGDGHVGDYFQDIFKTLDKRLKLNELLYGVVVGDVARAYPLALLRAQSVVEEELNGVPVTLWFKTRGRTVAAFDRRVDGKVLSFEVTAQGLVKDKQTGSTWTFEGQCTGGSQ